MKTSIKRLFTRIPRLILLGVALAALGIFLAKGIRDYNQEGSKLMQQLFEVDSLLGSKNVWQSRANWIGSTIPRFDTQNGAANHLLEKLNRSLLEHRLTLKSEAVHPRKLDLVISRETHQRFDRATVEIGIVGEERNIVEWMHEIQRPGRFTGIEHIELEFDGLNLRCDLQISQWYLGNNRSFDPSQHHQPEVHNLGPDLVDNR